MVTTLYPIQIDSSISLPEVVDKSTPVSADIVNGLRSAIIATETELGLKPSGIYTNVRTRLDALETAIATVASFVGNIQIGGDLVGITSQTVIGLQGRPIANLAPSIGQVLEFNGGQWVPFTIPLTAGGTDRSVQFNNANLLDGTSAVQIDVSNNLQLTTNFGILGLATSATYGGGSGVEFLGNATTNPTTDPVNGIILYVDAADNLLKYRQTTGTIITISAAGVSAVIFDSGAITENIISARSANQSPIDNTKDGIVNISSDTSNATTGASGNYSTISGGDQNAVSGDYGTCPGGLGNTVNNTSAFAVGQNCTSSGLASIAMGVNCGSSGEGSLSLGGGNSASADFSTAMGVFCTASGTSSLAVGNTCTASAPGGIALGENCSASNNNATAIGIDNIASGLYSVAMGFNNNVSGQAAVALGEGCVASAEGAFAAGSSNTVSGIEAYAIGGGHSVTARAAGALGLFGTASRYGEFVHASSAITSYHRLLLTNTSTAGATVSLVLPDSSEITMLDSKSYSVRITILGSRTDAQGTARESRELLVHASGGILVIDDDTTIVSAPNGQIWSYNVTTDGALILRIEVTGDPVQNVDFSAIVEWSELAGF